MAGIIGKTLNFDGNSINNIEDFIFTKKEKIESFRNGNISVKSISHEGNKIAKSKNYILIMDGEVFDYPNMDTTLCSEYCLTLFEKEGIAGLKKLNGSFSFVIYSMETTEIFLIVDRAGSRLIYYTIDRNNNLIFSTHLFGILKSKNINRELDIPAIFEFFSFHCPLGTKTYYKKIKLVDAGSYLIFKNGKIVEKEYNKMKYNTIEKSKEEYIELITNGIKNSIERRTRDNKKYGLLLSGGLDSRAILGASNKKMSCYTYADSYNNEVKIAKKVADKCRCKHSFLKRDKNHFANLVDEAVTIGDGRHKFDHAWGIGLVKRISKECDVLFHGFLFDTLFKGWGVYSKNDKKKIEETILEKSLYSSNIKEIFEKNLKEKYERNIKTSVETIIKNGEKLGAGKHGYLLNYFSFHSAFNQADFLCSLHNRAKITERFIALDNDLIDIYLGMPAEYRKNSEIFEEVLKRISLPLSKISNANVSVYSKIPTPVKRIIRKAQGIIYKIKFFRKFSFFNPSSTQVSWSNFSQLIKNNKKLKNKIYNIINNPMAISPKIFNVGYITHLFQQHLDGKKDYMPELFLILTFGIWFKKYGPKKL